MKSTLQKAVSWLKYRIRCYKFASQNITQYLIVIEQKKNRLNNEKTHC